MDILVEILGDILWIYLGIYMDIHFCPHELPKLTSPEVKGFLGFQTHTSSPSGGFGKFRECEYLVG